MSKTDELYQLYRRNRKRDSLESESIESAKPTEAVDTLYQTYRRERTPDFEDSIARVMQVAREKKEAEAAVYQIVDSATANQVERTTAPINDKTSAASQAAKNVFEAPSAGVSWLSNWLKKPFTQKLPVVGAAALAMLIITAGIVNTLLSPLNPQSYDLAGITVDSGNNATATATYDIATVATRVSQYIEAPAATSLGFAGKTHDSATAFYLGVNTVDLQYAALAKNALQLKQSTVQIAKTLLQDQDKNLISSLNTLSGNTEYAATRALVGQIAQAVKPNTVSFEWGRDTQQVYYASQLALDTDNAIPLIASINAFNTRARDMDMTQYSKPEVTAVARITAFVDRTTLSLDELRTIRDAARDLKALRRQAVN